MSGGPPLSYIPSGENFWEVNLMAELRKQNAIIYMDHHNDYHITGDGIKLALPFDWVVMCPSEDLVAHILTGIQVSIQNRGVLGY